MYDLTSERGKVMKCTYTLSCLLEDLSECFLGRRYLLVRCTRISLSIYICRSVTTQMAHRWQWDIFIVPQHITITISHHLQVHVLTTVTLKKRHDPNVYLATCFNSLKRLLSPISPHEISPTTMRPQPLYTSWLRWGAGKQIEDPNPSDRTQTVRTQEREGRGAH